MKKNTCLAILFSMVTFFSKAQKIATLEVSLPNGTNGIDVPVSFNLTGITAIPAAALSLLQVDGDKKTPVAFQMSPPGKSRILTWMVNQKGEQVKLLFELIKAAPAKFSMVTATDIDGALIIGAGNKKLLSYFHKTVYPPAGIDTNYKRSGFIHPLWTPHGQVLTNIQPKDHYHHYGIWNPWTHTVFEKDTVDFWNIKGKQGTVRFAKFNSITNGAVYAEYEALHEHVVYKKEKTEKVALNEIQTIRVYNPQAEKDYYIVDITSQLSCASESPLLIVAYRYGGLGWRFTDEWTKDNCEVLTSEGKDRKTTDGTKARWIIAQGTLGNDYGGAVMMSYPANYNHPEPLRIWDEKSNGGRGDMFANFAPTKDKDWLMEPGKTYTLKYRLVVFNGKFDVAKAESAWQYFAEQPKVRVIKK
ncbi:MAG: DUF6807 domain-containing protein [Chitinophagaceae bacterium]